jgi:hypothetical protein
MWRSTLRFTASRFAISWKPSSSSSLQQIAAVASSATTMTQLN